MKREVIFNWKVLLFLLPGLLAGAYELGKGAPWHDVWISSIIFGLFSLCIAVFVFQGVANYMADRVLEGRSVFYAALPFVGGASSLLAVFIFPDELLSAYRWFFKTGGKFMTWLSCMAGC